MAKIAILGTGAWGTALANILLENHHEVYMWGIDAKEVNDLNDGKNTRYFGYTPLISKPHLATTSIDEILDNKPSFILLAVPSIHIHKTLTLFVNKLNYKVLFINVAKGLNSANNDVWSKSINQITKDHSKGLVTLIGPSFANEVFNGAPTMVNTVSQSIACARMVSLLFNNTHFRCVEIRDEEGAEIIGALKNVMAIAMGVAYAQHTSINTRAAMLAQATKEISNIVKLLGGKLETLTQFCGIGDIYLTCTDQKSRNFSFGQEIAKVGINQAIKNNKKTIEGYETAKVIYNIIKKHKLNSPVFIEIYKVLFENHDHKHFVKNIMRVIIE